MPDPRPPAALVAAALERAARLHIRRTVDGSHGTPYPQYWLAVVGQPRTRTEVPLALWAEVSALCELTPALAALVTEADARIMALLNAGHHSDTCASRGDMPCDCGWVAAVLAALAWRAGTEATP